jgi:hypothetical protein
MSVPVATTFITQDVNIESVVSKVYKKNLNKGEREMEDSQAEKRFMFLPPAEEIEGTLPEGILVFWLVVYSSHVLLTSSGSVSFRHFHSQLVSFLTFIHRIESNHFIKYSTN